MCNILRTPYDCNGGFGRRRLSPKIVHFKYQNAFYKYNEVKHNICGRITGTVSFCSIFLFFSLTDVLDSNKKLLERILEILERKNNISILSLK